MSPLVAFAQSSITLSVTPSLFQISAEPGQIWQSSVKVINTNSFAMTVYAEAVNFAPRNEAGHGKFLPVFDTVTEGTTLAEWIDIDSTAQIEIEPESSQVVPFTVRVPDDATPGGHFAAILIGTNPPSDTGELAVQTSQIVSSLFFVRIEGDVKEDGHIRSFTVEDGLVDSPQAAFNVRFENRGNVHLQPQGQIIITNMWGKERGFIPVNHSTHFGNVLPESIRNFQFTWDGEASVTDIGRYTAEVSLAYGSEVKKFETSEVHFWVLPIKPLLITAIAIMLFAWFISWAVRTYIKRMLILAGIDPQAATTTIVRPKRSHIIYDGDLEIRNYKTISAPVRSGVNDFKERLQHVTAMADVAKVLAGFVISYRIFFGALIVLLAVGFGLYYYYQDVTTAERTYEVSIQNPDQSLALNSEEIRLNEILGNEKEALIAGPQDFRLSVINTSGQPGAAAEVAATLLREGYTVTVLSNDSEREEYRSVVVYDLPAQEAAVLLSKQVGNALLSATTESIGDKTPTITIYVGADQITAQ